MDISASELTILMFLSKQHDSRGSIYGNIAHNTGIPRVEVEELCQMLYENNLAEFRNDRVYITKNGREWLDQYIENRDERIREYVYKDFEFALLRFMKELGQPLPVDDFPEVLKQEAPKVTAGSDTMNLIQHLEIIWGHYFQSPNNKYVISPAGSKRYEYLVKEKGLSKERNSPSEFTESDKKQMNSKLDEILEKLEKVSLENETIWTDMKADFEELKNMYYLDKKNWRQLLVGKLTEWSLAGVISETFSKQIVEILTPVKEKLLE